MNMDMRSAASDKDTTMGRMVSMLACVAIAAGLVLPLPGLGLSREQALLAILALGLGAAAAVAANWWALVGTRRGQLASAADPASAIASLLRESCAWLQPFRPDFSQLRPGTSGNQVHERLASGCLGPMVVGVAVLAVAIVVMVFLDDALGSRGFFGEFLQTRAGRAAAGGFSAYLLIASFALIVLGVTARLHRGTTK